MIPGKTKTKIHFIGAGGIGMSAIAQILITLGYSVTGSDLNHSSNIEDLESNGAEIFIGHKPENISDQSVVVYSSAIKQSNPEIIMAKELGLPIYRRAEILADLMKLKYGIAVAGTHGKTTTTSILATIFSKAGVDPSYIVGGVVNNLGNHAKMGLGEYLIAETDESDGTFLLMRPVCSVVTNIDADHLDFYDSIEEIKDAFLEFINNTPFYGLCAINFENENVKSILPKINAPIATYAIVDKLSGEAEFEAILGEDKGFTLYRKGEKFGDFKVVLKGRYNIENALAAIIISDYAGIDLEKIQKGLAICEGAKRRMDLLYKNEKIEIIDDYAHHPTEIKAVISAMKNDPRKLTVFFEPHRYSRLKKLWPEFLSCFDGADEVKLLPVYAASEQLIKGAESSDLATELTKRNIKAKAFEGKDLGVELKEVKDGIILTLGAGSISKNVRDIVNEFS